MCPPCQAFRRHVPSNRTTQRGRLNTNLVAKLSFPGMTSSWATGPVSRNLSLPDGNVSEG